MRRWTFTIVLSLYACGASFASSEPAVCPSSCAAAVSGLRGRAVPEDDPRALFVRVQTCIAESGCVTREALDDPVWFENVLLGFVRGYIEGSGEWPHLERDCSSLLFLNGALCVDAMVRYHIETELVEVLRREGCGTPGDWAAVGNVITACLARDASWVARLGEAIVPFYRFNARYACEHPA